MEKRRLLNHFIPGIILSVVAIIDFVIYIVINKEITLSKSLYLFAMALVPFIFPLMYKFFKIDVTLFVNILFTIQIFLAVHLGSLFGLYSLIGIYDALLHTWFGVIGAFLTLAIIINGRGIYLKKGTIAILIMLSVVGFGGFWEIMEYASDYITGGDSQMVGEMILQGKSPISDTMEDLIVTAIGVVIFYVFCFIDHLNNYTLLNKLYKNIINNEKNK